MKVRFVDVLDDTRTGRVGYIILQVEKSDDFLIKKNFNPGYKFVIQALYNRVGAAGGHKFIPAYGESIQKKSQKINTVEGDVLGFYLSEVNDIYDIPDELSTEDFWGIINTNIDNNSYDEEYPFEEYYKVLYKVTIPSLNNLKNMLDQQMDNFEEIDKIIKKTGNFIGLDKEFTRIISVLINKSSLRVESYHWSTSDKTTISDYLWDPHDALPTDKWKEVKEKNNSLCVENEEYAIPKDAELYYIKKTMENRKYNQ